MYEYEMSEKLFLDIWEKYECPEEVSDPLTIYNILNDIIVKSKHWIVLDHYSHINFDEVKKVEAFIEQALYYARSNDVSKDYVR